MRRPLVIVVVLAVAVMAFAGCSSGGSGGGSAKAITGTRGLVMSFLQGAPPDKFLGEGRISVGVKLINSGTAQISAGNVYVSGFDDKIISGMQRQHGLVISPRSVSDPQGGIDIKYFEGSVNLGNVNTYKPTFLITSCYDYETFAAPTVCVDPSPFSANAKQKVCSPKDISLSGGQGAPVAVEKVEVSPSSGTYRFNIHLSNSGGGTLYRPGSQNCGPYGPGLGFGELDIVRVEEVRLGDSVLSCKGLNNNEVKLIDRKRSVLCEYNVGDQNMPAFTSPLTIRLKYGYSDIISKGVEILKSP